MLLQESKNGKLPKGVIGKVANTFSVCSRSVTRVWNQGKQLITTNGDVQEFHSKMVKSGRMKVQIDWEAIKKTAYSERTTVRALAHAIGVPKSTIHRRIREGLIRAHTSHVKPYLTDTNMKARLRFCVSHIDRVSTCLRPRFIDMHNYIPIDEKWFYMSKTVRKYYLLPDEKDPLRTCKSKRFIPKFMFLVAVSRPRFDATFNAEFDGKIGIWPLVFTEPAKRNSKNRRAGTLETKPILSVTKEVIRACLIEKVLPSIKEKWPGSSSGTIFIQQDNAKPHLDVNDVEFVEAARKEGLDICLCCQPPNSPDLNVLDLGFFRSLDSIQHRGAASSIDEFISIVVKAFEEYPAILLNSVFLTLQSCMVEVMKLKGGNHYHIPHVNKKRLIRLGQLPRCIECDPQTLDEANEALL